MGTKKNPARFDCYRNALPDEPIFILLARDATAPEIVEAWSDMRLMDIEAKKKPATDLPMVEEARQCAKDMRAWRLANPFKWREPITETPASLPSSAITSVLIERQRQITQEGCDEAHDDEHTRGQLADAAGVYALWQTATSLVGSYLVAKKVLERLWPWDDSWLKPRKHRENCVRAAALLIAEIERLDRAEAKRRATASVTA